MQYSIKAHFKTGIEEVDETDTPEEAVNLAGEYSMAFHVPISLYENGKLVTIDQLCLEMTQEKR